MDLVEALMGHECYLNALQNEGERGGETLARASSENLKRQIFKLLDEQDRPRTEGFIARRLGKDISLQLQQLVKEWKVHKTRSGNWTLYEPIETLVIE